MIERYGMSSAIIDAFDEEIKMFARGKRENLTKLIYRVMDKDQIDLKSLSKEEADYVKTTRVLMGQTLYSNSWLQM
jgi:5-methyltetrahydrofolate corrinoid/iron sulfur protein methyltransferase